MESPRSKESKDVMKLILKKDSNLSNHDDDKSMPVTTIVSNKEFKGYEIEIIPEKEIRIRHNGILIRKLLIRRLGEDNKSQGGVQS